MLRTWKNVLTKPTTQIFIAERDNFSGTLIYVLKWILIASMTTAILAVTRITLIDMWVMGPAEIMYSESPPIDIDMAFREFHEALAGWKIALWAKIHSALTEFLLFTRLFEFGGIFFYEYLVYFMRSIPHSKQFYAFMRGLLSPGYFLINVALFHYTSRLLGGQGQFTRYAFLIAAFGAPITIIRSTLWYSAYVGGRIVAAMPGSSIVEGSIAYHNFSSNINLLVATVLTSYWFFLTFLATRVEHKLAWWKIIIVLAIAFVTGYFLRRLPGDLLMSTITVVQTVRAQ